MNRISICTLLLFISINLFGQWRSVDGTKNFSGSGFIMDIGVKYDDFLFDINVTGEDVYFYMWQEKGGKTSPVIIDSAIICVNYPDGSISFIRSLKREEIHLYSCSDRKMMEKLVDIGGEVIITLRKKLIKYVFVVPKIS